MIASACNTGTRSTTIESRTHARAETGARASQGEVVRSQVTSALWIFLTVFPLPHSSVSAACRDDALILGSPHDDGIPHHRLRVSVSLCSAMRTARPRSRGSGSSYPFAHRISTFAKTRDPLKTMMGFSKMFVDTVISVVAGFSDRKGEERKG